MTGKKMANDTLKSLLSGRMFFVSFLALFTSSAPAADYPHNTNSPQQMQCTRCHNSSEAAAHPDWWTNQEAWVCGQCHNVQAESGQDVMTHKSGSVVHAQCTVCHNPHNQMQNRTYGTTDPTVYLYTGVSDTVGGVTTTEVKQTGAGWGSGSDGEGEWKGMLIIPNIKYQKFIYKIKKNTADTITIDTIGDLPDNNINTNYCKSGNTFAIVWGKLIRENVNRMPVKFFRETGQNSFADGDVTIDGICQVCHTQTKYFKKNGTIDHPGGVAGNSCTPCHKHDSAFKPTCTQCHGYPPLTSVPTGSDGLVNIDDGTGSESPGAHSKHAVSLGFGCDTCHSGGMPGVMPPAPYYDKQIQIGFNIADAAYQTGSYDGRTDPLSHEYTYTPGNGGTSITRGGRMECSNIYCHGSTILSGGTNTRPRWDDPSTTACGSCHGISSSTNYPVLGSHTKHTGPKTGSIGFEIGCQTCHNTTTSTGNSITDSTKHVNNAADWGFDGSDSRVSSARYRSASSGAVPNPPSTPYGSCSAVYCHSKGQSDSGGTLSSGDYAAPQWGIASTSQCGTCHNVDAGSNPPTSGSHTKHAGATASGGYAFVCATCHHEFSETSSTHVDGKVNVTIDSQYGTSATSAADGQDVQRGFSSSTCSNVYCHSIAQTATGGSLTAGNSDHYKTPSWGTGSLTCAGCHGYPSDSGSHMKHAGGDSDSGQYTFTCDRCHSGYVPPAATGTHVDREVNVATDPTASGSYNGDSTPGNGFSNCSNTYCHSNGTSVATGIISSNTTSVWGTAGPLACNSCHGNTQYLTDWERALPNYDADKPKANRHQYHRYSCNFCHYPTTTNGITITSKANHANGVYDLMPDINSTFSTTNVNFIYTYDIGGGSCTNVTCHNLMWGGNYKYQWGTSISASISFRATGNCYEVELSASSSGTSPLTYFWEFGDGETSTLENPVHAYSIADSYDGKPYNVTLTLRDANRHPATSTSTVIVSQPNSAPTGSYSVSKSGDTVTLTDLSYDPDYNKCGHSGPGKIIIDWGINQTKINEDINLTDIASNQTYTHAYSCSGSYVIRHSVTDSGGLSSSSTNTTVTIPENFSISGTVTDGTGSPLENATIYLKIGTTTKRTTTTASDGTYSFSNLLKATYTVVPSMAGKKFDPETKTVTLCPSATNINFTSTP